MQTLSVPNKPAAKGGIDMERIRMQIYGDYA